MGGVLGQAVTPAAGWRRVSFSMTTRATSSCSANTSTPSRSKLPSAPLNPSSAARELHARGFHRAIGGGKPPRGQRGTAILPATGQHHTAAIVTWRGEWWLRDEYLGVMRLRVAADSLGPADRAIAAGAARLASEAARLTRAQRRTIAGAYAQIGAAIVELVAQRLGYRVTSARRDYGSLLAQATP